MNPYIRGLLSEANMKWLSASAIALVLAVSLEAAAQDAASQKPAGRDNKDVPLIEAAKKGDTAGIRALLQKKAPVNQPEADGTTALHWAVRRDDGAAVDALIRAGADVQAANRYGVTV